MEMSTKENGKLAKNMEKGYIISITNPCMKEISTRDIGTDKENIDLKMEKFSRLNG
jgi:hypothetical protein